MDNKTMFIDRDFIHEVAETIIKQKWRSVMTAFGVFWGILILTILIGMGMGLRNGLFNSYTSLPSNSIFVMTSPTLLSYNGFDAGRNWAVTTQDLTTISQRFSHDIENVSIINLANSGAPIEVKYGDMVLQFPLSGEQPDCVNGFPQKVTEGRFINATDIEQKRPVCIVGIGPKEKLFGSVSPIGKVLTIDGKTYTVVGIAQSTNKNLNIGFDINEGIVIPITLMQQSYNQGDSVQLANIMLYDTVDVDKEIAMIDPIIRKRHDISPDDNSALTLISLKQQIQQIAGIFLGINVLIWIVGIGTLLAGLIGVCNIMLISVKERTKEIGVRIAMGAQPHNVVFQIMCESMALTTVSGLVGLCIGVAALVMINNVIGNAATDTFTNPYMPFWAGVMSMVIMIFGGLFSGMLPAIRALNIELVKALADE